MPGTNKVLDSFPSTACRQAGRQEGRQASRQEGREGRRKGTEERMKNEEGKGRNRRKNEEWVKGGKKSVHIHKNFTTSRQL